jgi:hypothetical protein
MIDSSGSGAFPLCLFYSGIAGLFLPEKLNTKARNGLIPAAVFQNI